MNPTQQILDAKVKNTKRSFQALLGCVAATVVSILVAVGVYFLVKSSPEQLAADPSRAAGDGLLSFFIIMLVTIPLVIAVFITAALSIVFAFGLLRATDVTSSAKRLALIVMTVSFVAIVLPFAYLIYVFFG